MSSQLSEGPGMRVESSVLLPDGRRGVWLSMRTTPAGLHECLVLVDGDVEVVSFGELVTAAQVAYEETHPPEPGAVALSELTPEERARVEELERHLLEVMTGSPTGTLVEDRRLGIADPRFDPSVSLESRIAAKQAQMGGGYSRATLKRRMKAYREQGVAGLIHGSRRTVSDYVAGFDPRAVEAIQELLRRHRRGAKVSRKSLLAAARGELDRLGLGDDISRSQLDRLLGELTRGTGVHHGAAARQRHGIKPVRTYGGRVVSAPGEMVQIDATRTNVHLRHPETGDWLPGNILTAVDVATRDIVAMRVIVGAVTAREVCLLLFDITQPASARAGFPFEAHVCHGKPKSVLVNATPKVPAAEGAQMKAGRPALMPTTIVLDRGAENVSRALMSVTTRVGIDVIWAPPGAGYAKGMIESLQRAGDYVASLFESYKGAEPTNHPKWAQERADFTRRQLEDLLWEWVIKVYRHRLHRGLVEQNGPHGPRTPAQAFAAYINSGAHIELDPDPYRYLEFLYETTAKVQDYGLRVNGRLYSSPDTVDLRPYAQRGLGAPPKSLPVRYDPYDVSRVFVRHPSTGRWLCVPVVDRELGTTGPYSELARAVALADAQRDHEILSADEVHRREAQIRREWAHKTEHPGRHRVAEAVERSRREVHSRDIDHAGAAVRELIDEADAVTRRLLEGREPITDSDASALAEEDDRERIDLYAVVDDDLELGVLSYNDGDDEFSFGDLDDEESAI